ncbi:MAG: dicarboxylate/amino acid:cation symporter [Planctomycetes bacterium]|nr:dicarboxylate/amino acid:cation symporter [Planctomycetota bacterium]
MSDGPADRKHGAATWIFVGLLVGAAAGIACNAWVGPADPDLRWFATRVAAKAGELFLRLLFMIVVPVVFTSLALGVAGIAGGRGLGRVGAKTIGWFVLTTAFAATLGIVAVDLFRPGDAVTPEVKAALLEASKAEAAKRIEQAAASGGFSIDLLLSIVPRNPVKAAADTDLLGLIFFALLFGIAAGKLPEEKRRPLVGVLEALYEISTRIIGWAMKLAPIGVAGLVFEKSALFGGSLFSALGAYLAVALGALAIQQFVVLGGLAWLFAKVPPTVLFRKSRALMATAFSTSSSNATLPTTLATAQNEFKVPADLAGFVLPLGATLNMNGTALFEGVVVLFLAQVSGLELTLSTQVLVVVLSVLTAIGAAGVPGGSLPLIVTVMQQVEIPPEMLALVLGVDRLVDMARTVPNVTGDLVGALVVARSEGRLPP